MTPPLGAVKTEQLVEFDEHMPPSVLGCTTAIASDESIPPGHRLTGVLMMIYGWAWYERHHPLSLTTLILVQGPGV